MCTAVVSRAQGHRQQLGCNSWKRVCPWEGSGRSLLWLRGDVPECQPARDIRGNTWDKQEVQRVFTRLERPRPPPTQHRGTQAPKERHKIPPGGWPPDGMQNPKWRLCCVEWSLPSCGRWVTRQTRSQKRHLMALTCNFWGEGEGEWGVEGYGGRKERRGFPFTISYPSTYKRSCCVDTALLTSRVFYFLFNDYDTIYSDQLWPHTYVHACTHNVHSSTVVSQKYCV